MIACRENNPEPKTPDPDVLEESVRGYVEHSSTCDVEMPENVIYVGEDLESLIEDFNEETGTISFANTETLQALAIKPGDILYSTIRNERHPDGFVLSVTSVSTRAATRDNGYGVGDVVIGTGPATALEAIDYLRETVFPLQCTLAEDVSVYSIDKQPDLNELTDEVLSDATFSKLSMGDKWEFIPGEKESSLVYTLLNEDGITVTLTGTLQHDLSKGITKELDHGHFVLDTEFGWGALVKLELTVKGDHLNGENISKEERAVYVERMKNVKDRVMGRQVLLVSIPINVPAGKLIADPSIDFLWDFRIEEIDGSFTVELGAIDARHHFHFENEKAWSTKMKSPMIEEIDSVRPVFDIKGELHGTLSTGPAVGLVISIPAMRFDPEGGRYKQVRKWKNFKGRSIKSYAGAYFELLYEADITMKTILDMATGSYMMEIKAAARRKIDAFVEYLLGFKTALVGYDQIRKNLSTKELGDYTWTITDTKTKEYCVYPRHGSYVPEGQRIVLEWATNRADAEVMEYDVYVGTSPDMMRLRSSRLRETKVELPDSFVDGMTVYWNVIVRTSGGVEYCSPVWNFHIGEDPQLDKQLLPIDLGLPSGLSWGSKNLEAEFSSDAGGHYYWGGVTPFAHAMTWSSYPFARASSSDFLILKYNNTDHLHILLEEDDAASRSLERQGWRMPTMKEWEELEHHCEWAIGTRNGIPGFVVSNPETHAHIFLPIRTEFYGDDGLNHSEGGLYWTSWRPFSYDESLATAVEVTRDRGLLYENKPKKLGLMVRPVFSGNMAPALEMVQELDFVDAGVNSTKQLQLEVKNVGYSTLSMTAAMVSEPFSCSKFMETVTVEPGHTFVYDIGFSPTEFKQYEGYLLLSTNASGGTFRVDLKGKGITNAGGGLGEVPGENL